MRCACCLSLFGVVVCACVQFRCVGVFCRWLIVGRCMVWFGVFMCLCSVVANYCVMWCGMLFLLFCDCASVWLLLLCLCGIG